MIGFLTRYLPCQRVEALSLTQLGVAPKTISLVKSSEVHFPG